MMYRVEAMTKESYHEYMCGGNNYGVRNLDIEAISKEDAINRAKQENKNLIINEKYVLSFEEITQKKEKEKANRIAFEKAEQERKEKRLAKEIEKANKMGLTLDEYKKLQSQTRKIKRLEKEITQLEKELAFKKNILNNIKNAD